jgi:catechol 2,3-dioxygenase-like lactoylglutathione lyase family enzyme
MNSSKKIWIACGVGCAALALYASARTLQKSNATRPPIIGVAYIALETNDMAAARKFYGDHLGYAALDPGPSGSDAAGTYFKVNDQQYIEVFPDLKSEMQDRLSSIGFETTNARQLRDYLASRNVTVPEIVKADHEGNLSFKIKDPEGHEVEFVQYMPGSLQSRHFGKLVPDTRVSKHMIHVGFIVQDRAAEDALFKDILGYQVMWYGGKKEDEVDYVDMRVPDGSDWLEYMLNVHNPSVKTRGVMNHLALGVESIQPPYQTLLSRGLTPPAPPKIGVDGKWQLNLYDPNETRAELMEFVPVRTPCCSPMLKPPVMKKD